MNTRASRWSRLKACILDWLYCWWPFLLAGTFSALIENSISNEMDSLIGGVCGLAMLATIGLILRNLTLLMNTGQTWGKHQLNLLVIMEDGRRAPSSTLFWRSLGPYVMMFIPLANIVTYFDCYFILGPSKKCLHDRLVGTIVIEADSYQPPIEEGTGLSPTYDDIGFSRFN